MKLRTCSAIVFTILLWQPTANSQHTASVDTFLSRAIDVLPIESRYAYHRTFLEGSIHLPARDPAESAQADE